MSDVAKMEEVYQSPIKMECKEEKDDQLENKLPIDKKDSIIKSTNEDVQRAIEGLKEIPDKELQKFLDDDFMEGLNVVDAWEGEEEKNREEQKPRVKEREQRQPSRERYRRERKRSYSREKPKREEKKREENRRDPSKSTKDIERDKMRTKRDNESKLLAEKEKAIKHLLDSDNVVPPGTETEAIQCITEKQNEERAQMRTRRSRDRRRSPERPKLSPVRRRSYDRFRGSPHRRLLSPIRRRSPFRMSPEKRRSSPRMNCDRRSPLVLSPERRSPYRRLSWERRLSADRRWSVERHRRRPEIHERRRSRSRDRQRSRSVERFRRRISRSPVNRRYSPRRRSRTRSRSLERRTRKRSPFINELARQLCNEAMMAPHVNTGYIPPPAMEGISPIMNAPVYQQDTEVRPSLSQSYMHLGGPQAPPPQSAPSSSVLPPMSSGVPPFINFDIPVPPPMSFEAGSMHAIPPAHYSSGPVMYNQQSPLATQPGLRPSLLPTPQPQAPQPVPAPGPVDHPVMGYAPQHKIPPVVSHLESSNKLANPILSPSSQSYKDHRSLSSHNGFQPPREERLKTPEPPVISDTKQFEKTSLSSLLEASVSAKDSSSPPVLYPGFKPEILRHCEHALRELPIEDPRLKMKGRFFFDPKKADSKNKYEEYPSNSILLQRGKNKIYWKDEDVLQQYNNNVPMAKQSSVQTHQKICQTEEHETETKYVQASVDMVDFGMQVYPYDIQHGIKEDKRLIMDRLDWNVRETYDYAPKYRETEDLRWSSSNSSQKRPWKRGLSPPRGSDEREHRLETMPSPEHQSRNLKLDSPMRSRDSYSGHRGGPIRDNYVRERYSPNYRRSIDQDDFRENRSDRSRGESPMELEDSEEDLDDGFTFQRGSSDWHGRGKSFRGKSYTTRGKHSTGRPYRGRGSYHKF